ncbi:ABC transporter substrate-binding protein [Tepiditoga spiralis]|uniref:ABC transporter substrate-binding protein n=1 Tax=Tepiditoga spiralis TaxID=2108365 RepID=A0A7G1G9X1_9BACT|nr:transporter substrate-binding domain-containing protein [Tepiditoga spiralis]BBE32084.1 ABC transporter substrate-binding protein [Tepiditoga spiralis]
MKKIMILLILILNILIFSEKTIRITNGEWTPYLSKKLKYYGVASRIVTDAFKNVNIKVEYGFFPWKRSYKLAKIGEWDGSIGWSYNEERGKDFYFSMPFLDLKDVLFFKKSGKTKFESYEDLIGKTIGTVIGFYYGEEFEKAKKLKIFKIDEAKSDEINFKKLLAGRVDFIVESYYVGLSILRKNFTKEEIEQIGISKKVVRVGHYSLILNKKDENHKKIIELFNKGLKQLKESGKYDQYLKEMYENKY